VVTSEDSEEAKRKIDMFKSSNDKWLIAVNMISEGVDIKRLRVLAYLTNVTTELYFRQTVGRIIRYIGIEDYISHCFLPSDPRFLEYANTIKEAQVHAIQAENELPSREGGGGGRPDSMFDPLIADNLRLDSVYFEGTRIDSSIIEKIKPVAENNNVETAVLYKAIVELGIDFGDKDFYPNEDHTDVQIRTREEIIKTKRKKANKLVNRLAYLLNCDPSSIHKEWMSLGGKPHSEGNEEDLDSKIKWVRDEIHKRS
jgi:superfamily II DNA or RNA helicase